MIIPIYRAKKIDSDEYVEGYYLTEPKNMFCHELHFVIDLKLSRIYNHIDPSTLAIHFPDMLDSEGNKIFASLSEDGKGGDIVTSSETSVGLTAVYKNGNFNFVSFPLDDYKNATHAEIYSSYIANLRFDYKGKVNYCRKPKVIGIQE